VSKYERASLKCARVMGLVDLGIMPASTAPREPPGL
jgi:hypothetical protein